jgi:very-short-patch-repair endonuclease
MERGDRSGKTTPRIRGTTPGVERAAKELRWRVTPAEWTLWRALQGRRLYGLKFRFQHPVGPFVVDFYCPSAKLVVEGDGAVHDGQVEQDEYRTEHLASYGYRLVRFRNDEVLTDLPGVLARIAEAAASEANDGGS